MAYVVNKSVQQGVGSSSSFVVDLPSHQQNDLILIFVDTVFNTFSAPTGYTEDASDGNLKVFGRYETGTPASTATMSGTDTAPAAAVVVVIVRGAASTSYVSATASRASSSGATLINPAVTPTDSDTIVFSAIALPESQYNYISRGKMIHVGTINRSFNAACGVGYTQHRPASTSTGTFEFIPGGYSGSHNPDGFTIAIKDAGSGDIGTYYDNGSESDYPAEMLHRSGDDFLSGALSTTAWDPTGIISTINSVTTYLGNLGGSAAQSSFFDVGDYESTSSANNNKIAMDGSQLATTKDLTNELVLFTHYYTSEGYEDNGTPASTFTVSDGTNARTWAIGGADATPNMSRGIFPTLIDMAEASYKLEDVGTFDVTTASHLAVGAYQVGTFRIQTFSPIYKMQTMKVLGGSANTVSDFDKLREIADANGYFSVQAQGGQTVGQFYVMHNIQVGNSGTDDVYWDSSNQSVEYPSAPDLTSTPVRPQAMIGTASLSFTVDAGTGKTVIISNQVFNMGDYHEFKLISGGNSGSSNLILNATPTVGGMDNALAGYTFSGCKEITVQSGMDMSGGCTIDSCVDTYAITVTSQTELEALQNCDFTDNNYSIRITGNHGGATWSLAGATVSGGTGSYDIRYEGTGTLTVEADSGSGWTQVRAEATAGTLTISAPTLSLTVNSSESSSDIKIFDTNTQTIEASTTGTTVNTTATGTYDWTVQKAGFLPQRGTGVVLGGSSVTVDVTLVADPVYTSSHGLTFTTDYSYNASTRVMTIVANQEGRDLYSALIDDFISETSLRNCPFPLVAVGPDRIDFAAVGYYNTATTIGATIDSGDIQFWKGAGMEWEHDTTGNPTKKFYSIKSANTLQTGSVVGYTQVNNGTASAATLVSDKVNEVIQFFEDTDGNGTPDYNYTGHLLFKGFKTGYYQARWDVINDSGVSTLEPYEYTINLLQDAIAGATGDQSITITTLTDHTSTPKVVGGKNFDYELVDPGTNTAENLLAQFNYDVFNTVNTSISGTLYTSYKAFDLPDLIIEAGANYETERGYFEGDGAVTDLSGVYLSRSAADHPNITRFQSNDGTYYVPAVLSNINVSGMPTAGANIRLQIHNETAKTASAWAGTTAYSLGDKVLRSTGLGTEQTAGLYMVCTTAGTSGGSEPTWDTVVGNTTADGTVTWTTYAILFYDADPASASYADSYTDGEEFIDGDTWRLRFAEMNGATSFKTYENTGLVGSTGFSVVVSVTADSVYATNAIDGSSTTVTNKFTSDFTNNEIDLDTNTDFKGTEAYAYYCYELTESNGMYTIWGAMTALDESNYRNEVSIFSIYLDETAGFVKQTDSVRLFRSDGSRPARDPTTGGNGIEVNWRNPVYGYDAGGGGFTASDRATLDAAATQASVNTIDSNVDAILLDTADMQPKLGTPASDISADIAAVKAETALIVADTNELQGDWVDGGRLDLILDARASQSSVDGLNDISAADVNAQCDTAISDAALATAASVATVDSNVDAIKAKTDQLTFTKANELDANIQSVNDVTVTGTGADGDEWGA